MIAIARPCSLSHDASLLHDRFIEMLPRIKRYAVLAFMEQSPDVREEYVQEVVANAYVAFARLVELGKQDMAYATPLARYAIRQVRSGRRVGAKLNVRDVMSPANRNVRIESLDRFDRQDDEWKEALIEDRHAGPAEVAASRIDVAAWFRSMGRTKRRIARKLAMGEATSKVAVMFGLTPGRISQLRLELRESWAAFQGEVAVA